MKRYLLACVLVAMGWMGNAVEAGSASAAPSTSLQRTGPRTTTDCLSECWKERERNTRSCKSLCRICTVWILGICFSTTVTEPCFSDCAADARYKYQSCAADCLTTT